MKYIDKNVRKKIDRLKHLKKSKKKMQDIADRNRKEPNSILRTRILSGKGEIYNSYIKRVGNIIHKNRNKVFDNINKILDRTKEINKDILNNRIKEEHFYIYKNENDKLFIEYENEKMLFDIFIAESCSIYKFKKIINFLIEEKKKDNFKDGIKNYLNEKISNNKNSAIHLVLCENNDIKIIKEQ